MRMKEIHVGGEHAQPREGQGRPVLGNPCVGNTLQWLLSFHTYGVMRAGIAFFHPCCRFSLRMEHIAKSLPGPIRAPLSLHIQSYSKRSLLGCIVVLHIII